MKTFDLGFDNHGGGRKIRRKRGNSNLQKLHRYIASLNNEQIMRMVADSGKSYLPNGADVIGRSIYQNALSPQPHIQTKLEISQPQDKSELQADKVAEGVTKGDTSISKSALKESVSDINTKSEGGAMTTTPEFDSQLQGTKGQGQKLGSEVKSEMEAHLNTDLSGVNIHTSGEAKNMSEGINAKAFTHGQDVYFNEGKYNPSSEEGKSLLAHELTHTVQQQGGDVKRKIQRSMKFEFQTSNKIWMYNPSSGAASLIERKFGEYGSNTEDGSKPAYLTLGANGLSAGETYFDEIKGPSVMEKADVANEDIVAQFVTEYKFINHVTVNEVNGKKIPAVVGTQMNPNQFLLQKETNNMKLKKPGEYVPNTFEFRYLNTDGKLLKMHVGADGKYAYGHNKHMKVGSSRKPGMTKAPQYLTLYSIIGCINSESQILGKYYPDSKLRLIEEVDLAKNSVDPNAYHAGVYSIHYMDFNGNTLKVHRNEDNVFQKGIPMYMEKKKFDPKKEQTAMELQSEHGGFVEFETPKWFRDWDELKLRIQDAVDMTTKLSNAKLVTDTKILKAMGENGPGRIREWPFDTKHLKTALNGRKLYVKITDKDWNAKIQGSEGIQLSEFGSLQKEHEGESAANRFGGHAANVFKNAFAIFNNGRNLDETLFANLKGFLQLLITYIYKGQVLEMYNKKNNSALYTKAAFALLARSNFASMYSQLLNPNEKLLFQQIIKDPAEPLLKEIEPSINAVRSNKKEERKKEKEKDKPGKNEMNLVYWNLERWNAIKLTGKSTVFFNKVGTGESSAPTFGPQINAWLIGMTNGKDLLSGGGFSAAQGGRSVEDKPGNKDYKLAQFEVRGSSAFGGNEQPAYKWVSYVKQIFDFAKTRSSDTPDNPRTVGVNEASKTGLK